MDHTSLKGYVLQKYFTITAFSKAINWKRNKSSRILNGVQEPTLDDIVELTNALDLDEQTFFNIFFKKLSTMYTKSIAQ